MKSKHGLACEVYEFKCSELHPWATSPSGGKFWEFIVSATRCSGLKNYRANIVEVMQSYTRHTKDVSTARWRNKFLYIYSIIRERCSPVPRRQPWWAWKLRSTACCNTPCAILRFSTPIAFLVCKSIDCVERLASRSRCNCHDVVAPRSEQLQGFVMLLKYIPVDIFQTAVLTDSFVVANFGSSLSSTAAWITCSCWRALRCRLSLRMGLK